MRLTWLGHAAFRVRCDDGLVIVLDPYRSGALGGRVSHGPIHEAADIVAITHFHEDHGWFGSIAGDPVIVDGPATVRGVEFRCAWLPHDDCGGSVMGTSRMVAFEVDGVAVWHTGDPGRLPTAEEIATLGRCDLLLLPVGGTYTIGVDDAVRLLELVSPRWTVPMHFRSPRVDLNLAERSVFLDALPAGLAVHSPGGSQIECPGVEEGVVLLEPAL